jgi:hypothetical protein
MVVGTGHPSYTESMNREIKVWTGVNINVRPYSKINLSKRAGLCAQVEHLPRKHRTLSSNSSTTLPQKSNRLYSKVSNKYVQVHRKKFQIF